MEKKPIKLNKREWDRIAECFKNSTCGCIWGNYNGTSLKKDMENY